MNGNHFPSLRRATRIGQELRTWAKWKTVISGRKKVTLVVKIHYWPWKRQSVRRKRAASLLLIQAILLQNLLSGKTLYLECIKAMSKVCLFCCTFRCRLDQLGSAKFPTYNVLGEMREFIQHKTNRFRELLLKSLWDSFSWESKTDFNNLKAITIRMRNGITINVSNYGEIQFNSFAVTDI